MHMRTESDMYWSTTVSSFLKAVQPLVTNKENIIHNLAERRPA